MAVLGITVNTETADRLWRPGDVGVYPVEESTKILKGSLVCVNAAGYAVSGADTAGLILVGVAVEEADNTSGADGAISVAVRRRAEFLLEHGGTPTQANVGDNVFIEDHETVNVAGETTNDIFCGVITQVVSDGVWVDIVPAIQQADVATHIADTSAAHAASAISIADAGTFTATDQVEAALQEIYPSVPVAITDPGDAGAIPVTRTGVCSLTSTEAGGETRTLAIPPVVGRMLTINLSVDGGDVVITAASPINQTGNNTVTMGDAGDTIVLIGVTVGAAKAWRVLVNDGCALSTVA